MSISCAGLALLSIYLYMVCRYRPWVGDDTLHCFTGGLSYYIHPEYIVSDEHLGEYYSSFMQAVEHAREYYLEWGGRLVTIF